MLAVFAEIMLPKGNVFWVGTLPFGSELLLAKENIDMPF